MPSSDDLDDPEGFVSGRADAEAAQLDISQFTAERPEGDSEEGGSGGSGEEDGGRGGEDGR